MHIGIQEIGVQAIDGLDSPVTGAPSASNSADSTSPSQAMDQAAQQILNLPALSTGRFDISPVLQLANTWKDTISPQLTTVKNQIEEFGKTFDGTFPTLTALVQRVSSGDADAISQFRNGLITVGGPLTAAQFQVSGLSTALTNYQKQLETGNQTIAPLTAQIKSAIAGLTDDIATQNGEIDQLDMAGKFAQSQGSFEIALERFHDEQDAITKRDAMQNDLNTLNTNLSLLTSFSTLTDQLLSDMGPLSQQWQTMAATLNDVNTNISAGSAFLNAQLQQLRGEVADAVNVANQL